MALANGAKTYKLKYGHRGGNHPVKDLTNNRVYISSQNHGYAVDGTTIDPAIAKEAFINVNDGTNEDLHTKERIFSQFSSTRRLVLDHRIQDTCLIDLWI